MNIFGLVRLAPENTAAFVQLDHGSQMEKHAAVQQIYNQAKITDELEQWNDFAVAVGMFGEKDFSLNLFKDLMERFPDRDEPRYNLAIAYCYANKNSICRYFLIGLSQSAASEKFRIRSQESLKEFDAFMGVTDADKQLKALQISYFLKAVLAEKPGSQDFLSLGRLEFDNLSRQMDDDRLSQLIVHLERGTALHPTDIALVEMLLSAKIWFDPNQTHYPLGDQLARLSPNSPALQHFKRHKQGETLIHSGANESFQELVGVYFEGDMEFKKYALADIAGFVFINPFNTTYRIMYAIALAIFGDCKNALKQIEKAELDPNKDYMYYFNISQVFKLCGDIQKALHYAEQAIPYIENDQDRIDLNNVIEVIKNDDAWNNL